MNPNDRLSRIVSELVKREEQQAFAHAEIDAYHAPGECHDLVERGFGKSILGFLRASGFPTVKSLTDALSERGVDNRWIYFHGPNYALGAAAEHEDKESEQQAREA